MHWRLHACVHASAAGAPLPWPLHHAPVYGLDVHLTARAVLHIQMLPIGSLPREMQELAVVQDLLNLLIGIEGKYITIGQQPHIDTSAVGKVNSPSQFQCDPTIDSSLKELVRFVADPPLRLRSEYLYPHALAFLSTGIPPKTLCTSSGWAPFVLVHCKGKIGNWPVLAFLLFLTWPWRHVLCRWIASCRRVAHTLQSPASPTTAPLSSMAACGRYAIQFGFSRRCIP